MTFEERREAFMEWLKVEYKGKMDELQCDMYSYPLFVPDANGGFRVVIQTDIVDITGVPSKSPFQVG